MNRSEVLKKIDDARDAIKAYKSEGLGSSIYTEEIKKIDMIKKSSEMLIVEARSIGAAGQRCPTCNGSGRVD